MSFLFLFSIETSSKRIIREESLEYLKITSCLLSKPPNTQETVPVTDARFVQSPKHKYKPLYQMYLISV